MKITDRIEQYSYRITWSEEEREFVARCLEFPSLSWLAETRDEAMDGFKELLKNVIEDLETYGGIIPEPLETKEYSGLITIRVTPDIHKRLTIEAAESGMGLSQYISVTFIGHAIPNNP